MNIANLSSLANIKPGTKILFANTPADGHFNPLTGIAFHLKSIGCDVRWYTAERYRTKIENLGISFYPLQRVVDFFADKAMLNTPERNKRKSPISRLNFDIINVFILRGAEFYEDIKDIRENFPFDLVVADVSFTGIPFIADLMQVPVVSVGIFPLANTSKDLPPSGFGMTPATDTFSRVKQAFLRKLARNFLFAASEKVLKREFDRYGISSDNEFLFDVLYTKSTLVLQSGCPGFEYKRSDLSKNIKFVGALLPYSASKKPSHWFNERIRRYKKIILVTQGTVESDVNKILVPTLEAFKNTDVLVIATTGGSGTAELRERFPEANLIIEDFIPFEAVMPHVHVYITNGGYGGVMLGIQHNLPLIVAGVHEGKNEINARIGFFKLGIDLKTEAPKPVQIQQAVTAVFTNPVYRNNVRKLNKELDTYKPAILCEHYIAQLVPWRKKVSRSLHKPVSELIY
ncbi:MAG TPA: glycosyltransferase [Flavisolibacter sp.]|nr:glycosyltransferase [Flavisolibacter sp.]